MRYVSDPVAYVDMFKVLMQVPSNMIVSKVKYPATYICSAMALWGLISSLMSVVHNFVGVLMARFFLGFVEAVFFPGALFFLSLFYNRRQFAFRTAILYSGSQLGNAFGGLFAIGILKLDGVRGLEGWRWVSLYEDIFHFTKLTFSQLFLIEGVITIGLSILFAFILPNSNRKILSMNSEELEWIKWNFESEQGQEDDSNEISAQKGLMMAIKDPKTWLFMAMLYLVSANGLIL